MRITQGYVSKSVMDFPFHQVYDLDDYNDRELPCVFFGCYRYEDYKIVDQHKGHKIVFWTGQDALDARHFSISARHFTAHPKVKFIIDDYSQAYAGLIKRQLVKPAAFLNTVQPQKLGKKIYAYCPASAPEYHGAAILNQLRDAGYDLIVGDGTHSQSNWRNGLADAYYSQAFIGLCLSEFAGGGGSIIEMGLRGMRTVTNVFNLPNCIPWNSVEDVMQAIELESNLIGMTNEKLANEVWNDLDHEHKWLEI